MFNYNFYYNITLFLDKLCNVTGRIKVKGKDVNVRFSSEDPKATFKCKLDRNEMKPCK